MPTYTGPDRPTSDYRARHFSTVLVDGRCFHDQQHSLVTFENVETNTGLPHFAHPLNVDHAIPHIKAGANRLDNYLGSCEACNKSRQDDDLTTAEMQLARTLWDSIAFVDTTDRASQSASWNGLADLSACRCREHDWHLDESPAKAACDLNHVARLGDEQHRQLLEWTILFGSSDLAYLNRLQRSRLWESGVTSRSKALLVEVPRLLSWGLTEDGYTEREFSRLFEASEATWANYELYKSRSRKTLNLFPSAGLPLAPSTLISSASADRTRRGREMSKNLEDAIGSKLPKTTAKIVRQNWPSYVVFDLNRRDFLQSLKNSERIALDRRLSSLSRWQDIDSQLDKEVQTFLRGRSSTH